MSARIEERNDVACLRLNRGEIRAFVLITIRAGKSQVPAGGLSAVFERDHMINVTGIWNVILVNQTILADVLRSVGHGLPKCRGDVRTSHENFRQQADQVKT